MIKARTGQAADQAEVNERLTACGVRWSAGSRTPFLPSAARARNLLVISKTVSIPAPVRSGMSCACAKPRVSVVRSHRNTIRPAPKTASSLIIRIHILKSPGHASGPSCVVTRWRCFVHGARHGLLLVTSRRQRCAGGTPTAQPPRAGSPSRNRMAAICSPPT